MAQKTIETGDKMPPEKQEECKPGRTINATGNQKFTPLLGIPKVVDEPESRGMELRAEVVVMLLERILAVKNKDSDDLTAAIAQFKMFQDASY